MRPTLFHAMGVPARKGQALSLQWDGGRLRMRPGWAIGFGAAAWASGRHALQPGGFGFARPCSVSRLLLRGKPGTAFPTGLVRIRRGWDLAFGSCCGDVGDAIPYERVAAVDRNRLLDPDKRPDVVFNDRKGGKGFHFYLTYKELRLSRSMNAQGSSISFYLTYKELRQNSLGSSDRIRTCLLSYLQGFETSAPRVVR